MSTPLYHSTPRTPVAASPQVAPADAVAEALDALERRNWGTAQGLVAAKLVAELRATLAIGPVVPALKPGTPGPWRVSADGLRICTDYRDENGNDRPDSYTRGGHPKVIATLSDASWRSFEDRVADAKAIAALGGAPAAPTPAQPSEDARDAARYRRLRAQNWHDSDLFVVSGGKASVRLGIDCPSGSRLDAAVDALLSKPEGSAS